MALILEVLSPGRSGEVRERHRLDGAPLEIGRGLENQVVLDDPHVDARHARLERAEDGSWLLVDLGSVNRIGLARDRAVDRVAIVPDLTLTLGRTVLRFRDEAAPVAPALPLARAEAAPALDWAGTPRGRIATLGAALVFGALHLWTDSTERGAAQGVFTTLMVAFVLLSMWAGTWSIASRVVLGRFNYAAHVTIGAAALAAAVLLSDVGSWVRFLFPAVEWGGAVEAVLLLALVGAMVAVHLSQASHLARAARWRIGGVAVGTMLALVGIGAALEEEQFSPVATFPADIKTLAPALVPKQTPEAFAETRADLKAAVDELLAKKD